MVHAVEEEEAPFQSPNQRSNLSIYRHAGLKTMGMTRASIWFLVMALVGVLAEGLSRRPS
jgi:hypothetical protein